MDQMVTMINNTRSLVQDNADHIELVSNRTNMVLEALSNNAEKDHNSITVLRVYRTLQEALTQAEEIVKDQIHELRHYHKQRMDIERGWLTETILNRKQLASILLQIEDKGFSVLPMTWYYQYISIDPIWEGEDHMAFRAMLPAMDDQTFIHYSLHYIPVPFGSEHTRVVRGNERVAIHTMTKASFVPKDCVGKDPVVCWPDVEILTNSCESQLVSGVLPESCFIGIAKSKTKSSTVVRVHKGDSMVLVVPTQLKEETTLRCPSEIPKVYNFVKPTKFQIPDKCILETKTWRIVNVQHVHVSLRQKQRKPVIIPSINISWPEIPHVNITNALTFIKHVNVPMVEVLKWDDKPDQGMEIEDILTHPYIASGSGSMALIISLGVLAFNVYMYCVKGRKGGNQREGGRDGTEKGNNTTIVTVPTQPALPSAPTEHNTPQMIPLLPVHPPPTYSYTPQNPREMMVTVTPEQIAEIMGRGRQDTRPRATFSIQDDMF